MKASLKVALSIMLIACIMFACKKESSEPIAEKYAPIASTSGNAGYKGAKPGVIDQAKSSSNQAKKNLHKNIARGRFYTKYGVIDGIQFHSEDGNEVSLEQSKVKGPTKIYNCVTKKCGRLFIREELAEGMSKSEMVKLGEKEKWPDHVMQGVKHADD